MPSDDFTPAGDFRCRVKIEQPMELLARGERTVRWETFATGWAKILPLSTRELLVAKQTMATVTHEIRLRYLEGITSRFRINFGGRLFYLDGPPRNIQERNRELAMMAVEQEGDAGNA
jgi:SPP1 family predicted phage head-tail adaptor